MNCGRTSCWTSRVIRVSPVPSRLTVTISQSSRDIIWNAMRDPSLDAAGKSRRSVPLRTTVAADGSEVDAATTVFSVAARFTKTSDRPSAENDGALPVTTVILPSGIDVTPNVVGVCAAPPAPRPPPVPAAPPRRRGLLVRRADAR